MNYALLELHKLRLGMNMKLFSINNDTEFIKRERKSEKYFKDHPLGILSLYSKFKEVHYKDYKTNIWFIHNNALLLRRKFIEAIMERQPNYLNFVFDGNN